MGKIEAYIETIARMEPDITPVDAAAYNASAAISLRRIADSLDYLVKMIKEEKEKDGE